MHYFPTTNIHPTWLPLIDQALTTVDPAYLAELARDDNWLPGSKQIFNAFSLPLSKTKYILFGESPYPRAQSANGYAFWDAAVKELWSSNGLSTQVNRATSLRNFIKMLLIANKALTNDTSQAAIAALPKQKYVHTATELFTNMQKEGILLLNATPVLHKNEVRRDAKAWLPFMESLLCELAKVKPDIILILFGKVAHLIGDLPCAKKFPQFQAEHPYNISFIHNPKIIQLFKPLHLLRAQ